MTEEQKELFFDLLTRKAVLGLDAAEQSQLEQLDPGSSDEELTSLEMTVAAISIIDLAVDEPMPRHLAARITADAERLVDRQACLPIISESEESRSRMPWFGWLGWGAALAAGLVLAFNFYQSPIRPEVVVNPTPIETPRSLTPAEQREEMLRSTRGMIKADWTPGNVKDLKGIAGDVVWSDIKQSGYMRFRGLPVNDKARETYQLWLFDKVQDKATPIDGGTFDIDANGEVVVPIHAKLRAVEPAMFAITVERPGGVVVSKREKIVALAMVAKTS